jgi:hypothetical protein
MSNTFKIVEVFKGGGTLDTGEKKAKVEELLSTCGVGMVWDVNNKQNSRYLMVMILAHIPTHV